MNYRRKKLVVEATIWNKDGDHPNVTEFRAKGVSNLSKCLDCGERMHDHGMVNLAEKAIKVCPGDVLVHEQGVSYPLKPEIFETMHKEEK